MAENLFALFLKEIYREIIKGSINALTYIKYYDRWKRSLLPGKNAIADEQPWIAFPVISFLEKQVNSDTAVFEYGAGGSTLFFANHAREVIAVEHDEEWYRKLKDVLSKKNSTNCDLNLILPERHDRNLELDPAKPGDYYTSEEIYMNCTFKSYVTFVDRYPDNYFDIILIDGRSRPSCISHSIPKIKTGGYLIVDNSNRKYYFTELDKILKSEFRLITNERAPGPYLLYFTETTLLKKL